MALADVACGHLGSNKCRFIKVKLQFDAAKSRRNHFHSISVRLALAIVFEDFIHSQLLEDCEFASSMPGRFSVEF